MSREDEGRQGELTEDQTMERKRPKSSKNAASKARVRHMLKQEETARQT